MANFDLDQGDRRKRLFLYGTNNTHDLLHLQHFTYHVTKLDAFAPSLVSSASHTYHNSEYTRTLALVSFFFRARCPVRLQFLASSCYHDIQSSSTQFCVFCCLLFFMLVSPTPASYDPSLMVHFVSTFLHIFHFLIFPRLIDCRQLLI